MNEQTIKLLNECSSGCEMGADSMKQICRFIKDNEFKKMVDGYINKHEQLCKKAASLLSDSGNDAKDPGMIATAFARITTEMKLTLNDDNTQIAKLLMDGCTMGIKSLGECINSLKEADSSAISLAKSIVKTEEDMMKALQKYL